MQNKKVVLITGANRGIGRALSLQYAQQGYDIILVGKSVKSLEQLYDEITETFSVEPAIFPVNLATATPDHILELKTQIQNIYGHLDVLVHNAAMSGSISPIEHLPPHQWQEVIQLNLNAPFLLTNMLLPLIKQAPAGKILFPLPQSLTAPKAYWAPYTCSKVALEQFAKTLALELQNTSIECKCIYLPKTQTDMIKKHYPAIDNTLLATPEQTAMQFLQLAHDF